jgi:hypothetical protein
MCWPFMRQRRTWTSPRLPGLVPGLKKCWPSQWSEGGYGAFIGDPHMGDPEAKAYPQITRTRGDRVMVRGVHVAQGTQRETA